MKPVPTVEERVWAVLAHLSAVVTGMGLPLPIIGWTEQRRKSNFAAFHCLQALGYQSLGYTIWLLFTLLLMMVLMFVLIGSMAAGGPTGTSGQPLAITWMIILFGPMILLLGLYFGLPLIAAVACALGKDFRYPFMGKRLARYLEYGTENEGWLNEDHEDRWVASMGHFSVIIALWGMLAPLTAWTIQGKRSAWLRFQSAQALALQALVLLLSVVAAGVYFFGFFVFVLVVELGENAAADSTGTMVGLAILIVSMLGAALIVLIVPLFHILGQWAGYRVLKGDDYRYPAIGRLVERWIPLGAAKEDILATEISVS